MSNTSDQTTQQSKTRLIIGEIGVDTETGIIGKGHSYDNGKTFTVDDTIYGRIYHDDDHGKIWKGIQDQVAKVVAPAKSAADSAVSAADAAVASAQVTSEAVSAIASATAEAKRGANEAMSRALSAWDVATGAKEAVTDFDPLLKSAKSDASQALAQIADTATALSNAKTEFGSDVAAAKALANTAQTTADSAVQSASENARELASQANALSDTRKAMDSGVASAMGLANAAQATANSAVNSAASVASDLAAVASQAKSNADGITKVTSDVGLLQTTVADNSGNISKIQETAAKIQQAVSDNSGAIMTATQTADSAIAVASDAKSNATVAVQTASGASLTATNAQSDATTAMVTANGAVTQASDAKSNATIAVQTASEARVTATNAQGDASIAKQTASDASVQIKNAQGDISSLQSRAGKIEASVATNSGAIANIQVTANELKASVSDNSGKITMAKQTADSAVTVASDAKSNATVAIQTASQASITASSASGQAASAVLTANGAVTTANNAKSDATVAVQTASGASLTATNAQSDATVAKQTASEATVKASNAESDFAQISIRANKIEANVATNSGAIASVQQTANGLTTTVADIKANGGGRNLLVGTSTVSGDVANGGRSIIVKGAFNGYDAVKTNVAWSEQYVNLQSALSRTDAKAGDWYTISVYVKADKQIDTGGLVPCRVLGNGDANTNDGFLPTISMQDKPITTQWKQYSWSFQLNDISLQRQNTRIEYNQDTGDNWIYWGGWVLEKGIVAHDWSPAPDDLQNQFTQIKQSVDGIATTINDPKTGLNATYQTAAGNSTTISNVKGDVSQLQATANGLTSRVGSLESKTNSQQTTIDQNKAAIALKADQTDVDKVKGTVAGFQSSLDVQSKQIQTKVSASDVSGMLTGYATQSYAQSLVTQTADKWNLNLTNLQTDVNAIKTTGGGVNLVQNTSTDIVVDATNSTTNNWAFATIFLDKQPKQGDLITISAEGTLTGTGTLDVYQVILYNSNTTNARSQAKFLKAGQRDSVTLSLDNLNGSGDTVLLIYAGKAGDTAGKKNVVHHLMVEEGTVAHTWSPAPSDLATVTSVANLSATVNGIQSQVYNSDGSSRITQLSGLIQSKVGTDDFNNLKQAVGLQTLDSADINNMKTNGHYFVHNLANNPVGGWVYVDVTGDGSTRIRQDVYQDNGTKHQYRRWVDTNWTGWEEGATYTEINQLQDKINLRVTKGDLISQINLQTGASLIQSDKLVLDANTTVLTGKAWIPVAAIANLTADQVQAGTLSGSKVHAGDNNGNGIDMGVLSDNYVGLKAYANNGDHTDIDLNGIHNYGASYDTRIQQGKITTDYLTVRGGGTIDFRDSSGTGMTANGSTLAFNVGNSPAGYLSYNGMPVADIPDGAGGNELQIRYGLSAAIIPNDNSGARATFSGVAQKIGYMTGTNQGKKMLSGLEVDSNNHLWLGTVNSDATWNRLEINDWAGLNIAYHDNTHFWISDGRAKLYKDTDDGQTATELEVHGWAWVNGWVEAAGHSQHSTLSSKTRIEEADPDYMLDLVNSTDLTTFAFKSEVAEGLAVRHIGPIIDDVNDVAQYRIPTEFIAPTKKARDDDNMIGALFGAVQSLTKRIKALEEKTK